MLYEMDNERLIMEVSKHTVLFNRFHSNYSDIDYRNKVWQQIATILNLTGHTSAESCKTRWRNLRSSFVNELRKVAKGNTTSRKWIYYDHMLFLIPYVRYNRATFSETEVSAPTDDEIIYDSYSQSTTSEDSKEFIDLTDDNPDNVQESDAIKMEIELLPKEDNEISQDDVDVDDDNDPLKHFFLTMYKTVKTFPPHLQIAAKKAIFKEVTNIEEKL